MGVLRYLAFCLGLLALILPSAFGGGFAYDGLGVKARGMGGAFRAVADDWSAAYYNPAGYYRILDNQLAFNVDFFHNRYTAIPGVHRGDGDTLETGFFNGQEVYNHHSILSIPQGAILARLPVWGETVFGFSIMQLFDQNQSWELFMNIPAYNGSNPPGKQYYNNLDVVAFQLTAARGFMEDRLSIGVGLALLRGDLIYNSLIFRDNPYKNDPAWSELADRPYDKITEWYHNDGRGWGFGYRIGLLYEVNDRVDVGAVYAGKSSIDISGASEFLYYLGDNATLAGSPNIFDTTEEYYFVDGIVEDIYADFETTLDVPSSIGGGVSFRPNEKLTLALDAEMVFWSQFEGLEFKFSNFGGLPKDYFTRAINMMTTDVVTVPVEWDDAVQVMLGANYWLTDFTEVRAGFGIDQSPMKEETFIPQFFDLGTKYRYSFGVGFEIGFWHLDLTTVYTHHPDLSVTSLSYFDEDGLMDNLPAEYKAGNYQIILGITHRF